MEIGKRIRRYRTETGITQDELADKIFVSRQSVSNWENDKTYPDLKSVLLLYSVFGVSLDELVKGDIDVMKEALGKEGKAAEDREKRHWNRINKIQKWLVLFVCVSGAPIILSVMYFGVVGFYVGFGLLTLMIGATAVIFTWMFQFHKFMKSHDLHKYEEIIAYLQDKTVGEVEKQMAEDEKPIHVYLFSYAVYGGLGSLVIVFIWIFVRVFVL
jgi:transcriptional regulator with XRE-family HTH domain